MISKSFTEYDMRDEFSLPVHVSYNLAKRSGVQVIDPDNKIAGVLTRKDGETYLVLADFPDKEQYTPSNSHGIVVNSENKVFNQDDSGDWYASTWDGQLQFVFHKYVRLAFDKQRFGGDETSKWMINDYSIVSQYDLCQNIEYVTLSIDCVDTWFHFFSPNQKRSMLKPVKFENLAFNGHCFSLIIGVDSKAQYGTHVFKNIVYTTVELQLEKRETRDFVYKLSVTIRNFFHMMLGKEVGISRIILNRANSRTSKSNGYCARDNRENWFLDQAFLPNHVDATNANFETQYSKISNRFDSVLRKYLVNSRLQKFVSTYLICTHFRTPVDTQIVTLVSAVESYYRGEKYKSNGKIIKKALDKLKLLGKLLDNSNIFEQSQIHGKASNIEGLFTEMVDARDYIVHGDKANKYTSEVDLAPDLILFKNIIRKAILHLILSQDR